MKKRIINRIQNITLSLLLSVLVLCACSCSHDFDITQKSESFTSSKDCIVLSFRINELNFGRTIIPELPEVKDLGNFVISKKEVYESSSFVTVGTFDDYEAFSNAQIEMPNSSLHSEWIFKVTASTDLYHFEGATRAYLNDSTNYIDISLSLVTENEETGTGSFEFTLDYSIDASRDSVSGFEIMITDLQTQETQLINSISNPDFFYSDYYQIKFSGQNVQPGSYRVIFFLWSGDTTVGYWQDTIKVLSGKHSVGSKKIVLLNTSINDVFNLNYVMNDYDGSNRSYFKTGNEPPSLVTSATLLSLPAPVRQGYLFTGWSPQFGNGFIRFPYTLTSNMTLEAHWQKISDLNITYNTADDVYVVSSYNPIDGFSTTPTKSSIVVYVVGPDYTNTISSINSKLNDFVNNMTESAVTIDLSYVTELEVIEPDSFTLNPDDLTVILPGKGNWYYDLNYPSDTADILLGNTIDPRDLSNYYLWYSESGY